mmetsp:Transcript_21759/g.31241  ORF Transcript_21759/g.31241 Transcript_21759/m.31241 type:complete len:94 (+) Transcript_21759:240-521(+)
MVVLFKFICIIGIAHSFLHTNADFGDATLQFIFMIEIAEIMYSFLHDEPAACLWSSYKAKLNLIARWPPLEVLSSICVHLGPISVFVYDEQSL